MYRRIKAFFYCKNVIRMFANELFSMGLAFRCFSQAKDFFQYDIYKVLDKTPKKYKVTLNIYHYIANNENKYSVHKFKQHTFYPTKQCGYKFKNYF